MLGLHVWDNKASATPRCKVTWSVCGSVHRNACYLLLSEVPSCLHLPNEFGLHQCTNGWVI